MKTLLSLAFFTILLLTSCEKNVAIVQEKVVDVIPTNPSSYTEYIIKQGQHFSDKSNYVPINTTELKFVVKFDSSAIYQNQNPSNQGDINKLYGFADNNKNHHEFSARFGWRWKNNNLEIFGYIYNNGIMSTQKIANATIGAEHICSIKVTANSYVFTFNQSNLTMPRNSITSTALGYKLFPYFGGDEMAPKDIHIWIKDVQ